MYPIGAPFGVNGRDILMLFCCVGARESIPIPRDVFIAVLP